MRSRAAAGAAATVAILGLAWFGARAFAGARAERVLIAPASMGAATPADFGIPFSDFRVASDGRELRAWLVRAPDSVASPPAVLALHGNRTSIADLVGLQLTLRRRGVTSMVFDYSGFGSSTGTPSVRRLREDAVAAFGAFVDSVGRGARKFVLGTSLGAAVLLDALVEIQLGVEGVILVGTFASSRAVAVRQRRVPRLLAFIVPDHYDNVRAARQLRKPLLVVHSTGDELFPIADAEALVAAAGGQARLVRLEGVAHDAYLTSDEHWESVLDFVASR
jgi:hypothetical protein